MVLGQKLNLVELLETVLVVDLAVLLVFHQSSFLVVLLEFVQKSGLV
jgi:hypothetical protein